MARQQRGSVISVFLLGVAGWLLLSHVSPAFVGVKPSVQLRGSTAVKGFAEEFAEWRKTLTPEEQEKNTEGAQLAMDKDYQKTDNAEWFLPEDKMSSFSKIVGKFLNASDSSQDSSAPRPEYQAMQTMMGDGSDQAEQLKLKNMIVQIDRVAERRYHYAVGQNDIALSQGKLGFPNCSPQMDKCTIPLTSETKAMVSDILKDFAGKEGAAAVVKDIEAQVSGSELTLYVPRSVKKVIDTDFEKGLEELKGQLEAEGSSFDKATVLKSMTKTLVTQWLYATMDVKAAADGYKAAYESLDAETKKTKADVLKELWAALPSAIGKEVPPLDEDLLADLAKEPAAVTPNPWGTADVLWKSEAIDKFGTKYLLGIFEEQEDARKAFLDWNAEYEKAFADRTEMFGSKEKVAQAEAEQDADARDKIVAVLDEATSSMYS